MPHETLLTIKPRKYQQEIYESCKNQNCLVVLPTGIGKTLIALMLAITRQKEFPGSKILFLAPTRPLAEQHLSYFKKHLPELFADLQLFTGKINASNRRKIWQTAEIIFSTPQCIGNDLKKGLYNLTEVSLLIEDECHRCLKNYAYTYVAQKYNETAINPRVLGLTASPGAERKTIEQIAKNLNIDAIELRTRDSPDVKEYLQELNFEAIRVDFPDEFDKLREFLKIIFNKKIEELKNRKLLFGPPMKKNILETQSRIMKAISSGNKHFNLLMGASTCSQAIKVEHAIELIETQTLSSVFEYFHNLFQQARENKSKAVINLVKQPEFNQAFILLNELITKKIEHPKLIKLKEIIESSISINPKSKAIVFTQYRSTAIKISKELNENPKIKARVFVGQTIKKMKSGEEIGLSQKEQHQMLEDFKSGESNVLVATSIGEEGLDIPEVNTVVFYEPIPSAIRKIQRAGRTARLMEGNLIILITRGTRDEAYYYASINREKKMHAAIKSIKENMDLNNSIEKNKQKTLF
ncbi:MAG: helicase-related protein [archaeon]|nr:helicase-related protein [archaeon]